MKLTGMRASVFLDTFDGGRVLAGGAGAAATEPDTKYFVVAKGRASDIPVQAGSFFQSPRGAAQQISLAAGDRVFPIDPMRFCKTSASFEYSFGSVEAGDDCDPGATILDGILTFSGSLAGLYRYDDETEEFDDVTGEIIGRFLDSVEDDGTGAYALRPKEDGQMFLLALLNATAQGRAGKTENWIFAPINISKMSTSLGNADAQNQDLAFTKGEGQAVLYRIKN